MKKIVIPTDFSENAENALNFAVELFKNDSCEFYLLHAYADEVYNQEGMLTDEFLEEFKETTRKKTEKELENVIGRFKNEEKNNKHRFQAVPAFGILVDEVNDLVNREDADLVIMSTRGKTNDRILTFGSHTLQVIKYVQCPVLSIPENYQVKALEKILFPTNFMVPYQARELKVLVDLARESSAEIHMLYVSKFAPESYRQRDNRKKLEEQFQDLKLDFHQVERSEKTRAIHENIQNLNIDLLVLVNSRHSYLENILYKSTLDKIGLQPEIPFLVFQNFHRN